MFSFFFFQAEDGIRDRNVTGVQTCALPISFPSAVAFVQTQIEAGAFDGGVARCRATTRKGKPCQRTPLPERSEERRVGKECRSAGGGEREKKTEQQAL